MILSNKLQTPNGTQSSYGDSLASTIVDSGIRYGQQVWTLELTNPEGFKAADVLTADVNGTTYTAVFGTDFKTTLTAFAASIQADALVTSATFTPNSKVVIKTVPNVEITVVNSSVTNSTVCQLVANETTELHIIPAVVVLNQDSLKPLRTDIVGTAPNTTTYVGYALAGASSALPVWRIARIVETATTMIMTYADGNENMDNVWDDRASLSYS